MTDETKQTGKRYHYTECGLDNVWLINGFSHHETPYGTTVTIHDVDDLHDMIGLSIVDSPEAMSGKEVRFIRHELELSQKVLGEFLGVDAQTVARWEKDISTIAGPAQRLMTLLYQEKVNGDTEIKKRLERLSAIDAQLHEMSVFALSESDEWEVYAA